MLSIFRKIEVFLKKIDKTASKILNQEERVLKMKNLETFERVILLLL